MWLFSGPPLLHSIPELFQGVNLSEKAELPKKRYGLAFLFWRPIKSTEKEETIMNKLCFHNFLVIVLILFHASAFGATIRIPVDLPTIQAGIDAAEDEDLVLVSSGTYIENIDFLGKTISVQSEAGADETVIDGDQAGSVVTFASGESEEVVIEGFTIMNGSGTIDGSSTYGGGIYFKDSSPTIERMTITSNSADEGRGGGIYCEDSSPMITNCRFSGNSSHFGGGIYCCHGSLPTTTNCTIAENTAFILGGGICSFSSIMIENCTVSGNSAGNCGGGIYCLGESSSSLMITNCTISENSAVHYGGGICCGLDSSSSLTVTNCTISANSAGIKGGGIYCYGVESSSLMITNCTIAENSAGNDGGGIYCYGSWFFQIGLTGIFINSVLWENYAPQGAEIYIKADHGDAALVTAHFCDIQGGEMGVYVEEDSMLSWLDGNIDSDPLFVGGGDYHLTEGSPCIDAGNPETDVDTDIDGDARPLGAGFDMGSDEYTGGFTLELDGSYGGGTLSLEFTLGTPEEATWLTFLILTYPKAWVIPLWSIPLPVIYPPVDIPISFPFPSLEWMGIWSGLFLDGFPPQVYVLEWVDTSK